VYFREAQKMVRHVTHGGPGGIGYNHSPELRMVEMHFFL
jgi:hypothetical protein